MEMIFKRRIENLSHLENIEIYKNDFTKLKINENIDLMFVDAPKK